MRCEPLTYLRRMDRDGTDRADADDSTVPREHLEQPTPGRGDRGGEGASSGTDEPEVRAPEVPDAPAMQRVRARQRVEQQARWVDTVVDQAIARGEFEDLPLAGKPIPGIADRDPDWWLKAFVQREQVTGVLPETFALRKDDAELDARLDREGSEARVRALLEEFNARVVAARRQLQGGPPVVTPLRDVEAEVVAWRGRRTR